MSDTRTNERLLPTILKGTIMKNKQFTWRFAPTATSQQRNQCQGKWTPPDIRISKARDNCYAHIARTLKVTRATDSAKCSRSALFMAPSPYRYATEFPGYFHIDEEWHDATLRKFWCTFADHDHQNPKPLSEV